MTEFGPCYILSPVAPEAWQPQITGPSRRLILDDVNMNYGSQIAQHVHDFNYSVSKTATLQTPVLQWHRLICEDLDSLVRFRLCLRVHCFAERAAIIPKKLASPISHFSFQ